MRDKYNLQEAVQEVEILNITPKPIETIYKAYRQCYAKGKAKDIEIPTLVSLGTTHCKAVDYNKMINFITPLMNDGHTSPLEHCCVTFAVSGVSRALTHQLVRHRTGKYNQQSQRYINFKSFDFILPPRFAKNSLAREEFMKAMQNDAQQYENLLEIGIALEVQKVSDKIKRQLFEHVHGKKPTDSSVIKYMFVPLCTYSCNKYVQAYMELYPKEYNKIKKAVQEDARYVLSNACASNIIFTMDFNNFRKFYGLRNCVNAQWEIRELARKCGELLKEEVPFILEGAMNCGKTCTECERGRK